LTFLSPHQVAKKLKVRPERVYQWLNSGELPGIDLSSNGSSRPRWRIDQQAIDSFLESKRSKPAPTPAPQRRRVPKPTKQYV